MADTKKKNKTSLEEFLDIIEKMKGFIPGLMNKAAGTPSAPAAAPPPDPGYLQQQLKLNQVQAAQALAAEAAQKNALPGRVLGAPRGPMGPPGAPRGPMGPPQPLPPQQ
jgi:hypothetical protein